MFHSRFKVAFAALTAAVGVGFATLPANAAISGNGMCSGLQLHSTWLDWGSGLVSVNVRNHTGDNPSVRNRTIRFKVTYTGPKAHGYHGDASSQEITLKPSEQQSFQVFDWHEVTGRENNQFDGNAIMNGKQFEFTNCFAS